MKKNKKDNKIEQDIDYINKYFLNYIDLVGKSPSLFNRIEKDDNGEYFFTFILNKEFQQQMRNLGEEYRKIAYNDLTRGDTKEDILKKLKQLFKNSITFTKEDKYFNIISALTALTEEYKYKEKYEMMYVQLSKLKDYYFTNYSDIYREVFFITWINTVHKEHPAKTFNDIIKEIINILFKTIETFNKEEMIEDLIKKYDCEKKRKKIRRSLLKFSSTNYISIKGGKVEQANWMQILFANVKINKIFQKESKKVIEKYLSDLLIKDYDIIKINETNKTNKPKPNKQKKSKKNSKSIQEEERGNSMYIPERG